MNVLSVCVAHICGPILVDACTDVVIIDAHVHAICRTPHIAARIAQLLDRHGLADIPDTPADLTEGH